MTALLITFLLSLTIWEIVSYIRYKIRVKPMLKQIDELKKQYQEERVAYYIELQEENIKEKKNDKNIG